MKEFSSLLSVTKEVGSSRLQRASRIGNIFIDLQEYGRYVILSLHIQNDRICCVSVSHWLLIVIHTHAHNPTQDILHIMPYSITGPISNVSDKRMTAYMYDTNANRSVIVFTFCHHFPETD